MLFPTRLRVATLLAITTLSVIAKPNLAQSQRLYQDEVRPHWIGEKKRYFWYEVDTRDDGRQFRLVDTQSGTREPLFDHRRLAAALSQESGVDYEWKKLPIYSLEMDTLQDIRIFGPRDFLLNRSTYALTRLASDIDREPPQGNIFATYVIRPTRRTGRETTVTFINNTDSPLKIFWIDSEKEKRPYGTVEANSRRRQHTYGGHVWAIEDGDGKIAGVIEAPEKGGSVVIPNALVNVDIAPAISNQVNSAIGLSPDGEWKARVKQHNLYLVEIASGQEFALTKYAVPHRTFRRDSSRDRLIEMEYNTPDAPDHLADAYWSSDSKWLMAFQTQQVPERRVYLVNSSPRRQLQPTLESYPYLKPGDPIPTKTPRLFDIETRQEIAIDDRLLENPWTITFERFSPDGRKLYLNYNQRGHQILRLVEVDCATGQTRAVIEESSETFIHYSGKYYLHWLEANRHEVIWMSERDGWNHLYRYDLSSATAVESAQQITKGKWNVRKVIKVDEDDGTILFEAVGIRPDQDPYHIHIARIGIDGKNLTVLTEGDGMHEVEWSPDGDTFLDRWSRVDQPPVTELRSRESGSLLCELERTDASEFDESQRPRRFVAKGRDGSTDIWGIIHFPKNFQAGQKYPIVEEIYAGPHGHHVPKRFRTNYATQRELADRGCFVVQIDGMGTAWRSKAFHDVCYQNLRDAGFPDRIAWMKAAAKEYPEMDIERVGIYGGSAGGQNAMAALLWHHDFYDVAVADCGCHDNRMDKIWWNEQWLGWPVGKAYADNSNVVNAHLLEGKLMLIVGELDRNVDPASTFQAVGGVAAGEQGV